MKKNDSGITLIALVMTIILLIIIVSISSYEGSRLISTSKVQTLETNMLTIQTNAKIFAEKVEAKVFTEKKKEEERNKLFTKTYEDSGKQHYIGPISLENNVLDQLDTRITNSYVAYTLTKSGIEAMGLEEIVKELPPYVAVFSTTDYKIMDIVFLSGINYKEETFYTLSYLKSALEED